VSAVKWIAAFVFGLAGLAGLVLAVLSAPPAAPITFKASVEPVTLRPMPMLATRVAGEAAVPAPPKEPKSEPPESLDAGVKAQEKPADVAVKATPDAGVKAAVAVQPPTPAPTPVKTPPAPAPIPAKTPAPPAPAPAPVAAPPATGDGLMNLQASDTADIYVDGRKVGSSPVMGFKTRAGLHKVRFDCYDAAGNAVTGAVKLVTVTPEKDLDVEFTCAAQ
jgi:hypothetical protein